MRLITTLIGTLATGVVLAGAEFTLMIGGDVMLHGISPASNPLQYISGYLKDADLALANLEVPPTSAIAATSRKSGAAIKARTQFVLRADPGHIPRLAEAGVDALSLANNHAMDYREVGLFQVISALDQHSIAYAGAGATSEEAERPVLVSSARGEFALVSYLGFVGAEAIWTCTPATPKQPGVAALQFGGELGPAAKKRIDAIVKDANQLTDFVIVAMHWGLERQSLPTAYQVQLGRMFVDAGADLVVGHHPHVLQGAEIYRGKPIFYSLGNLISLLPATTALFRLRVKDGKIISMAMTPCTISAGTVRPEFVESAKYRLASFLSLCKSLQSRFPVRKGEEPTSIPAITLTALPSERGTMKFKPKAPKPPMRPPTTTKPRRI